MDKLLFVNVVAKRLNCSRPMVYKLLYQGDLKAIRIGKRGIRIKESSVEAFLKENEVDPSEFNPSW